MLIHKIPQWHIDRCVACEELQAWWKAPEVPNEKGHVADTNINVGDYFSHGGTKQVSLISGRVYHLRIAVGKVDTHVYTISHDIGGHYYQKTHEEMSEKWWVFIPDAHQLLQLGYEEWAFELLGATTAP